jgi:hypothetical protein
MAPNVEQEYLFFRDDNGHGYPVAVGNADCLDAGLLASRWG